MAVRVFCGILQIAAGLVTIWLSKIFIDETVRNGTDSDIVKMIALLVATVIVGVLLRQFNYFQNIKSNARGVNRLRSLLFSKIFERKLFGNQVLHSGDVASRVMKDVETVCDVNFTKLPQIIVTLVQLTGAFLLMRWFDPRLAWTLLLLTPAVIILSKLISKRLRKMTTEIRKSESRIQMHVQECAEHDSTIRALSGEGFVCNRLTQMQDSLAGRIFYRSRFTVIIRILMGLVFGLGYTLAFVWGGLGLRNGTITFGVMASFLQLVGQIQHPIFNLLNAAPQIVHSTASIDRIEEVLNASEKGDSLKNEQSDESSSYKFSGVRLENVSFAYDPKQKTILDKFSFNFKPGSKTAILGETGAGKTTLFRIMLGLVQPDAGHATVYTPAVAEMPAVAGKDISKSTRQNFAFVPQGNTLVSGSLRLNLQLAKPDATDEEMLRALHIACADFVKDMPEGLNTELGERGLGLSEGQAERIAVARGLLQNRPIMLLDEISAALDAETEKEMFKRIFEAFPQKTMIFITHRDAVCKLCDNIIRL